MEDDVILIPLEALNFNIPEVTDMTPSFTNEFNVKPFEEFTVKPWLVKSAPPLPLSNLNPLEVIVVIDALENIAFVALVILIPTSVTDVDVDVDVDSIDITVPDMEVLD